MILKMLDAKIASALRSFFSNTSLRRRSSFEEQRAQKYNRFFRGGKQFAYMIFGHFQPTGACDAPQGLSELFNNCF